MTTGLRKTRVLHCITSMDADGAQQMLLKLTRHLNNANCEFRIVNLREATDFVKQFESLGVVVDHLAMRRSLASLGALRRLARIIDDYQPDILQGWMYHGNLLAWGARLLSRHKPLLVWNIRKSVDNLSDYKLTTRLIFHLGAFLSKKPAGVIYCGERVSHQHLAFGYSKGNAHVIPNGFDLSRFQPAPEQGRIARERLGLSPSALVVGLFARFHPNKDHRCFLKMAALVSRACADARFILAGRGVDGTNSALVSAIDNCGLNDRVLLLGERSDIDTLFPALDVYCLSSSAEGFPNSLGEAMACGLPCVTTDAGASREVVGNTGFIAPVGDAKSLAEGVLNLLSSSPEERSTIGARARKRVNQEYSLAAVSNKYEAYYRALLEQQVSSDAVTRRFDEPVKGESAI